VIVMGGTQSRREARALRESEDMIYERSRLLAAARVKLQEALDNEASDEVLGSLYGDYLDRERAFREVSEHKREILSMKEVREDIQMERRMHRVGRGLEGELSKFDAQRARIEDEKNRLAQSRRQREMASVTAEVTRAAQDEVKRQDDLIKREMREAIRSNQGQEQQESNEKQRAIQQFLATRRLPSAVGQQLR